MCNSLSNCVNKRQRQNWNVPTARSELRRFGAGLSLLHAYKLQENFEKQARTRKNEAILKEEAKRRQVYEKYLLGYQGGSNVLRDFHTNQF